MKGEGVMRLATAFDEITPMKEPRPEQSGMPRRYSLLG
jgi:hypothetical protein